MEITEVKIKVLPDKDRGERLRAFCSMTIDNAFVIRDLKVIEGSKGAFVAMPSRKLTDKCSKCGGKNHLRARFCNECGGKLDENRAEKDEQGRAKLHADIAHPINSDCREMVQKKVLAAYNLEIERSKEPGYVPPHAEDDISSGFHARSEETEKQKAAPVQEEYKEEKEEEEEEGGFGSGLFT